MKIVFDIDDTIWKIEKDSSGTFVQVPDIQLLAIAHWFFENGHDVFVWSAGGVDYARQIADKLGLGGIAHAIVKEKRGDMDISFDDENVKLAKVNIKVKRKHLT